MSGVHDVGGLDLDVRAGHRAGRRADPRGL